MNLHNANIIKTDSPSSRTLGSESPCIELHELQKQMLAMLLSSLIVQPLQRTKGHDEWEQ
jgi:hypothetical protein